MQSFILLTLNNIHTYIYIRQGDDVVTCILLLFYIQKPQLKVYVFIASKNLSKVSCAVQFFEKKNVFFSLQLRKKVFQNVVHDTQEGFERVNYYG